MGWFEVDLAHVVSMVNKFMTNLECARCGC